MSLPASHLIVEICHLHFIPIDKLLYKIATLAVEIVFTPTVIGLIKADFVAYPGNRLSVLHEYPFSILHLLLQSELFGKETLQT